MGERMPERAVEATALVGHDEDRAIAIVAMSACALSGFVMGLLVRGDLLPGMLMAALATLSGAIGWWLRGVVR